ncbi:hypothetical protein NWQ33_03885 [Mycoplasmopsis cynos]|nr:hypothetical protein [Mycoplasmopsis cynos]
MHPEVLAKLEEPFLNSTTASFINTVYDTINKKYRGLQIITTSLFPEKEFTQGKNKRYYLTKIQLLLMDLISLLNQILIKICLKTKLTHI